MINTKLFAILLAAVLIILTIALGALYYTHESVAMQQRQISHSANERQRGQGNFEHAARPATETAPAVPNPWAQPKR